MKSLVLITTYNEIDNIEDLIALVYDHQPDIHILVIDDSSPDGTGECVTRLMKEKYDGKLFLLTNPKKMGTGAAYITGFKWALQRDYELIFELDGDFSHNPKYLKTFIETAKEYDVILGSRYIKDGGITNWNWLRRFISRGGSFYSQIILGLPYKDLTGGYKCFRRKVIESINLDEVYSTGYSFQIEMTYRSHLLGFKIKEVPIIFEERREGQSKMDSSIIFEAIWKVFKLRSIKKSYGK
ncbi:MAG: polyprenol monophosphomannose synthase [Proteobacteria bacterium]|nr:polyprenol monophosphomannose synthase [Pseudomonadota bacterium]